MRDSSDQMPDAVMRALVDAYPSARQLREYVVAQYGLVPDWAEQYICAVRSKQRRGRRKVAAERRRRGKNYRSNITKSKREAVYARDHYRCVKCGATEDLSLDHIVPVAKGGSNQRSNLQTMCQPCNGAKGLRMPEPAEPEPPVTSPFVEHHLAARAAA